MDGRAWQQLGVPLRVLTWNVYAGPRDGATGEFVDDQGVEIKAERTTDRVESELQIIRDHDPQFVVLQECTNFEELWAMPMMEAGYVGQWFPKNNADAKAAPERNGIAIFWPRGDEWQCLEIVYTPLPHGSQVVVRASFLHASGQWFTLATTHLKAKTENAKVRLKQMSKLLDDTRFRKGVDVFMGDLNATPTERTLEMLETHRFSPVPALSVAAWTTCKARPGDDKVVARRIDYVLCREDSPWKPVRWMQSPEKPYNLPASGFPSDHLPVIVDFTSQDGENE